MWDERQLEIIRASPSERQIVVAGPGTGKTAVACQRVARLVDQGVPAGRILVLSFTRTAVAELRNRIVSMAVAGERARGVRISTIDSHVWSLRTGFDDADAVRAFGGSFELGVQRVIELLRDRHEDLVDFVGRMEHVIIDEAQDVTGDRALLVALLLDALPDLCGITVLADPAQAIYGFTSESDGAVERGGRTLLDRMVQDNERGFVRRCLDTVYRTKDPRLLQLLQAARRQVCDARDHQSYVSRVQHAIEASCHENVGELKHSDLAHRVSELDRGSMLVLFRRRVDVLAASSYLSGAGVQHRLRMGGTASIVRPWVGWLLYDCDKALLSRSEFADRWSERCALEPRPFEGVSEEESWQLLHHLAASSRPGLIDLVQLRRLVARDQPPVELCYPELGATGPIVGTVHGSKGREADRVLFVMPRVERETTDQRSATEELEEGRVLYVGATRARELLHVAHGGGTHGGSLQSGRAYRLLRQNRTQLEVGRPQDVDARAHLAWSDADRVQRSLASMVGRHVPARARAVPELDYVPQLYADADNGEVLFGQMSRRFNQELRELWNRLRNAAGLRPANEIQHLYVAAVSTVALPEDEGAGDARWRRRAFALAPVVRGFPMIPFFARATRR
jgi:hypothetical protein